ncbi:EpsG family protein [Vagococcus fluvialis]|uniref:EpsG family protein n=1 Tax=Vagococcus fluvialis TaxID=2738 RepID=UPI003D102CA0
MSLILYISIILFNLLPALIRKKIPTIYAYSIIILALLIAFNIGSLDNINYIYHYNNLASGLKTSNQSEFGFVFLMQMGNKFGMSWSQFKFLISLFSFSLMYVALNRIFQKELLNFHYLLIFYSTYLYFYDAEQIRNFIAMSLFLYALSFFNKGVKGVTIYVLLILLATTVHNSMVFFLIFVLVFKDSQINEKKIKIIFSFSIILAIATYLNQNQIPFVKILLSNLETDNSKVDKYLNQTTNLGFLLPLFYYVINIFCFFIGEKIEKNDKKNRISINIFENGSVKLVKRMLLLSIVFLPLTMQTVTFYRLFRNLNILIISSNLYFYHNSKAMINKSLIILNLILWQSMWFILDIALKANEILIPFFFDNLLS